MMISVFFLAAGAGPGSDSPDQADQPGQSGQSDRSRPTAAACGPCQADPTLEVVTLTRARVDSIADNNAEYNLRQIDRTDSLYRLDFFGRPGMDETKVRARTHLQLRSRHGYDYIFRLASDPWRAFESDEDAALIPLGKAYSSVTAYPLRFMKTGMIGPGSFCLQYEYPQSFDERTWVGGEEVRIYGDTLDEEDGGGPTVMILVLPTILNLSVDLVFQPTVCGRLERQIVVDQGDTLDLQIVNDIEGWAVRRAGLHELRGLAVWRSVTQGDRDPVHPRVGACAYFPHLRMKLPFLPGIGLSDLRDFDVPEPVLPREWFTRDRSRKPEWLDARKNLEIRSWDQVGPRPEILKAIFPEV
jgi:hypothetical protein